MQQTTTYIKVIKYNELTQTPTRAEVLRYFAHSWGQIPQSIASPSESAVKHFLNKNTNISEYSIYFFHKYLKVN